jgi:hypothetical protein
VIQNAGRKDIVVRNAGPIRGRVRAWLLRE